MEKLNFRSKPVTIEYKGKKKSYTSVKEMATDLGICYQTAINWVSKKTKKPSIEVKITVEDKKDIELR